MPYGSPQPEREQYQKDIAELHSRAIGFIAFSDTTATSELANGLYQHSSAVTPTGVKIELTTSISDSPAYYLLRLTGPKVPLENNTETELRATWEHDIPSDGIVKKRIFGESGKRKEQSMLHYSDMSVVAKKLSKLIPSDALTPPTTNSTHETNE